MAELRKVVKRQVLSNFGNVAPSGGGMFYALAAAADEAYKRLGPWAADEMARRGEEAGREVAKGQVVNPSYVHPAPRGESVPPPAPLDPNSAEGIAADAVKAINGLNGDRDLLAKTIMAEAGGEGYDGMLAAGAVMANRAKVGGYGDGLNGVIMKPGQFSAWNRVTGYAGGEGGLDMDRINPSADAYRAADAILSGQYTDPTGGATHYYNPSVANPEWGAGAGGDWTQIGNHIFGFADAGRGGSAGISPEGAGAPPPDTADQPAMIRSADGSLTTKRYSPFSGPILQAYNAAAGMAYVQEMSVTGVKDLMGISQDFLLDPTGFEQAATAYVDEMIKAAPSEFRSDLRSTMEKEVQRRVFGIMDDRQADIRQRASNASTAMMAMKSADLAAAIASGNPDEIAAAEDELQGVLAMRERIPGMAWTSEQSELEFMKARAQGESLISQGRTKQKHEWDAALDAITDAASTMMHSDKEGLLNDPAVRAGADPEKLRAATAAVMLRDLQPELGAMTPDEVSAIVAQQEANPAANELQVDLVQGMKDFAKKQREAWAKDPVAAAQTYFPEDQKPAPLPVYDPTSPTEYLAALRQRAVDMRGIVDGGYTSTFRLLSAAEIEQTSAIFSKDTPADMKALAAAQIVNTLGDDAATYFKNVGADDPILKHVGMLIARGGSDGTALEAMRGAEMLAAGTAQKPTRAAKLSDVDSNIAWALTGIVPFDQQQEVMETAKAIAAYRNPNTADPTSDEAKQAMKSAVQAALGQTTSPDGKVIGGVQEINGSPVLLPPGVAGDDASEALEKAFLGDGWVLNERNDEIWAAVGGAPMLGGVPLNPAEWSHGRVVLTPAGGNMYRLSLNIGGQLVDARNPADPDLAYVFDLQALIEAAR